MKALITGASGFIGAHLAEALIGRGYQVTGLVRRTSRTDRLTPLQVELAFGDVGDSDSLRKAIVGADAVFHLAGLVKALAYEDLLRVNEQGTENVARACAEASTPPVLVVVSSLAAAGPAPNGRPRQETDPLVQVSNYGRSKRAGEVAAGQWAGHVPLSIVRPPVVFGEGDPAMLAMVRPIKWLGMHVVPGFTERRASMIHAADLAAGLVAVAERGGRVAAANGNTDASAARGYYFLAADEHPTFAEWGKLIATALGRERLRVLRTPEPLIWGMAAANESWSRIRRRPHIFNIDKVREATAGSWTCTADRARQELGFSVAAPLAERFSQMTRWYESQGWI
ncbi:MAG: NAD-dependent epimerase/dehydratase family protein [Planctomycetia bacterium]|nr:NAD-dependent epimerase/dehydratase family protein [Planctomycetia bacterium]